MTDTSSQSRTCNTSLPDILALSSRLSQSTPFMKPFVRFSSQIQQDDKQALIWHFDEVLQKVLLSLIRQISTPQELLTACNNQWEHNLTNLRDNQKEQLRILKEKGGEPNIKQGPREILACQMLEPKSKFLYVGCGSGQECLKYATRGFRVLGVDTDWGLVKIANDWADYLSLPFEAVCMDVFDLGLRPKAFGGFLLEFYGEQPSFQQTQSLQQNLESVLDENGVGFIVARRKHYSAFWHTRTRLKNRQLRDWMGKQTLLDFCFSEPDACEENLGHGLYWRSHTVESLRSELEHTFDVLECSYEPYNSCYLLATVKRKTETYSEPQPEFRIPYFSNRKLNTIDIATFLGIVSKIESLCCMLEEHKKNVLTFFANKTSSETRSPVGLISVDLSNLIPLLIEAFEQSDFSEQWEKNLPPQTLGISAILDKA